jgi:subtilisin family serine protease
VLDSRLKFIQQSADDSEALALLEASPRFAVRRDSDAAEPLLRVLVQIEEQVATETMEEAGISVAARAGDVVAGEISLAAVEELDALEGVVLIESSRPMVPELNASVGEIRANVVHSGPPGLRGAGVIVGIIDSGIDWRHETFRSAILQTRVLRIWDQNLVPQAGEASPAPFGYGVEYDAARINTALASPNPLTVVRHMDDSVGHGTHVAGIAAGDGSPAGNGSPASTFIGVAPEADIIVVSNRVTTEALSDSASTLDGVQYIINVAQALQRPCVINLSQGDNLGPHDGTSLLERGIDNLLGGAGRSMVKSAGNAANAGVHASGTVTAGGDRGRKGA